VFDYHSTGAFTGEKVVNIIFFSTAQKECRAAVEDLLYFNPRQNRVRQGVSNSIRLFGSPEIVVDNRGLCIRVGGEARPTLFAYDLNPRNGFDLARGNGDPVGLAVFGRTLPDEVTVAHLAVHPDYTLPGGNGGLGLAIAIMEKVKEVATRMGGVRRLVLSYRQEIVLRV